MDAFGCDYECRTIGESIAKYHIPNDWCAEFDAYDDVYPIVCIPVDQIRKSPAIMALKLRIVENKDDEYAGCMILTDKKTIAFKIDYIIDLINAIKTEQKDLPAPVPIPFLLPAAQSAIKVTDDEIGKNEWREILTQIKVQKTKEYFVYWKFMN